MPMGFVYVLFNPAYNTKVKIGQTIGTAEERAKKLYSTGVPERFYVVYDELVSDCALVENAMHTRFAEFRRNEGREFFEMPMKMAVRALIEEAAPYQLPEFALTKRAEILPKLRHRFPQSMNTDLSSVAVIQLPDLHVLELRVKSSDGREELMEQIDLEFIAGIEQTLPAGTDVRENVTGFVDSINLATLIVISEELLNQSGREKAITEYNGGSPLAEPEEVAVKDVASSRAR